MGDQKPIVPVPPVRAQPARTELTDADLRNIQGDVILGLPKKCQKFYFFKITKVPEFRQRLSFIVPMITTCNQTHEDREAIRNRYRKPDRLHMGSVNISFSWKGLQKIDEKRFVQGQAGDPNFEAGMKAERGQLRDDVNQWNAPRWAPFEQTQTTKGFEDDIHGVVMIVGEDELRIADLFARVKKIFGDSIEQALVLDGKVRPGGEEGHEHFGFKDGISQPFILGTEKWRKELPGQGSVRPGVILLGRDGDIKSSADPTPEVRQPWQIDGTYMAFRYLHQRVPEFNKFLTEKAEGTKVDKDMLGARMIGRWKSGAPLDIANVQDDRGLANDENENNNFFFEDNDGNPKNPHSRCPFSAHIRKTNPGNDLPEKDMVLERVLRRGIPYGPELDASEKSGKPTAHDRGLLFVCYQSHIVRGFHLMQRFWANNVNFINDKDPQPGIDPIIGQTHKTDTQPEDKRSASGLISANVDHPTNKAPDFFPMGGAKDEWVVSRGGEYFFTPSISAMEKYIAL